MELEKYRALVCAIESGSLTAAAEKLQYTPSGISRVVSALEAECGFPLLLREHGGVRPTAACQRLLPGIYALLHSGEACAQLAAQIRGLDVGTVVIGTAYSAYYHWLAGVIGEFHHCYPGIQVQLCSGYSSQLAAQLHAHQLDLCIISQREGEHSWLPLCRDEMMAWVPAGHPLAALDALPIERFAAEPYIETHPGVDIDNARVFAKCGVQPNLQFSTMDSFATYSMVEAGLGLALNNGINGMSWNGHVKMMPLFPSQTVELGIAGAVCPSPAAQKFWEFAARRLP